MDTLHGYPFFIIIFVSDIIFVMQIMIFFILVQLYIL